MYRKILIANRGEIAIRIARTLRRMGVAAAAVHSSADAGALHVREIGESVCIGGESARESYLDIEAVLRAARAVGADAIHPGFGFLSENAAFARACGEAGIAFIGPAPASLELFGDKARAKQLARSLGIPTAEGIETPTEDVGSLLAAVEALPRPLILKAAAGGGGKGMRVIREGTDVRAAVEAAIREGRSAFGDGRLIAERYLQRPRHIEVQILGDGRGNLIHLWDRECSLQRRYQKVVEEAPVASVPRELREQLWSQAVAIGRATEYLGLGTVEFAVTQQGVVFLEVNPRLQVEHPVTEAITGLDLVRLQVETLARRELPFAQADVPPPRGAAVQARLYAEDAQRGFLPATGRVMRFEVPSGVRCDSGVAEGSEVTPHYDPMVAKLIAHGDTRESALDALADALAQSTVLGVVTNRAFLVDLLSQAAVRRNDLSTEFIDQWLASRTLAADSPADVAALAAVWLAGQRRSTAAATGGAWGDASLTGWRMHRGGESGRPALSWTAASPHGEWRIGFGPDGIVRVDDELFRVLVRQSPGSDDVQAEIDGRILHLHACDASGALSLWERAGVRAHGARTPISSSIHARIADRELSLTLRPIHDAATSSSATAHGAVRAPMMGILIAVHAREGQKVTAGERLATLESMKMEIAIEAPVDGVVAWAGCEPQAKVERHQDLFRIEPVA